MEGTTSRINTTAWFWGFVILHLAFWTLAPTLFRHTIPFDTAESFAWGHQWQWGYDKHPFLAPWLVAFAIHYLGGVGFGNYLMSQLCVLLSFLAIWQLAKKILSPEHALLAVLVLFGIDFYTLVSAFIDPDIVTLPTWAFALLAFYQACKKGSYFNWIWVGIAIGLAVLTKYTSFLLLASMLIFLLTHKDQRVYFKSPPLYLGIFVFMLVILPNLIWQLQHHLISLNYVIERGHPHPEAHQDLIHHITFPLRFIGNQLLRLSTIFILGIPLLFCKRNSTKYSAFDQAFLLNLFLMPFAFLIIISLITGTYLYSGWAFPFFTLSGIIFIFFLRPTLSRKTFAIFASLVLIVTIGLTTTRYAVFYFSPYHHHRIVKSQYPMQEIANAIKNIWQEKQNTPLEYVAGSRYLASLITTYLPEHPTPYFEWDPAQSPWINEQNLRKKGAIFVVWFNDGTKTPILESQILKRFPDVTDFKILTFSGKTKAKIPPLQIGVGILRPV